jgi:transposase
MPGSKCPEHGIKTMAVPWAGNTGRFTGSFEKHAIGVLNISKNRSGTAGLPGISRDGISGITRRPVSRGPEKGTGAKIKYPGIGEKSFPRGQSNAGVLTDIEGKRAIDAAENRDIPAVTAPIDRLKEEQRAGVKAISTDFRKAYISVCGLKVKNGDIVHDKFHIAKYMNGAVNTVRIAEHKRRKKAGGAGLTGTKFLWLKKPGNFTDKDKRKRVNPDRLEVGKTWMPRELFNGFWNCPTYLRKT